MKHAQSQSDEPAPLRLGDLSLGERRALGSYEVSEEEMLRYARAFDPQPFHVDLDAARSSHFGGLVASGWFTVSVYTRLLVDGLLSNLDTVGSPGAEHVSWPAPLRPGVTMSGDVEVKAIRPSLADRSIGVVGLDGRGVVDGAEVLRISIAVLVRR